MTDFHLCHFIWLTGTAFGIWLFPIRYQADIIALVTGIFLAIYSPLSALLLFSSSLLVYGLATSKHRPAYIMVLTGVIYCGLQFLLIRGLHLYQYHLGVQIPTVMGLAYYTCRHIHYIVEIFQGNIKADLRQYLRYQFFLPAMVAGPIHRYANFQRQCGRRRFEKTGISKALERILYGYIKVVVLGNYLVAWKGEPWRMALELNSPMMDLWLESLMSWVYLYLQFSGWTDIAIGFALVMGFRLEENFNKPFLARNLIDFWQRWHITLSSWCRDYVFKPVLAVTRRPLLATCTAMVTMGVWHELSLYYLFWGIYHAIGIAIVHQFIKLAGNHDYLKRITGYSFWTPFARVLTFNYIVFGGLVSNLGNILLETA
jgi:alginate O-acetyltransferase complex protein AlgI